MIFTLSLFEFPHFTSLVVEEAGRVGAVLLNNWFCALVDFLILL